MEDFSFQGKVWIGTNVNGKPQAMRWVGDAMVKAQFSASEETRKESYSGLRRTSATLTKDLEGKLTVQFFAGKPENFAIAMGGSVNTEAGGSVTGEAFPDSLVAGDFVMLDNPDISNLVVQDSAGTPATLVEDTDYRIEDAAGGMVEILNVGAYTQPFVGDYDYAARKSIALLTQRPVVRYLIVTAENTVDGATDTARLELYRAKLGYASELDLHAESLSGLQIEGTLLIDSNNDVDPKLGGYGRWHLPGAA